MEQRTYRNSGLWIGRLRGIDVWIHWFLIILFIFKLHGFWIQEAGWKSFGEWALWSFSCFTVILLHELGHCAAAFAMGGGADAIVLWPLGGLAQCDAPNLPRAQFWVAAGGPLVNVAIMAVLGVFLMLAHSTGWIPSVDGEGLIASFSVRYEDPYWVFWLKSFWGWNAFLLIFNLLPMYPLDGGRMLQALVWGRVKSMGRASMITVWVSRITILLVFCYLVLARETTDMVAISILVFAFYHTEMLRHRSREEEQDYIFGYDFSRGYTSLERTMVKEKTPRRKAGGSLVERAKTHFRNKRRRQREALRRQVDELLEKITREGMPSLSARERRFLRSASRKLKETGPG